MNRQLRLDKGPKPGLGWVRPYPLRHLWREMTTTVPNQLTTLRLALIPPLWLLALLGYPVVVGVVLFVAATTDVLDGYLARRGGLVTEFGSRFDSIADHLLTASTVAWLLMLRPDFFREQRTLLLVWLIVGAATLLVGWLRFGRVGALHLYSAKAAGVLGYGFAIYLLVFGSYPKPFFYLVLAACLLGSAETLLVHLTRDRVDEHIGSIVLRRTAASPEPAQRAATREPEGMLARPRGRDEGVAMSTTPKPWIRDLSWEACEAILHRNEVGRLAYARANHIDIEPVHYVYASGWIYGRTSPGTKMEMIGSHWWPVAFEVDEVEGLFRWRSVVVHGGFYSLHPNGSAEQGERWERAVELLQRLVPETLHESDPVPHRTTVFRIAVQEVTGREAEPEVSAAA